MAGYYPALRLLSLDRALPSKTPDGLAPHVHADDPAVRVMTDFREVTPVTIEPGMSIDSALGKMKKAGVRLLLVPDHDDNIIGIITAYDIQGERPLRMSRDEGVRHADIRVDMLMTPLDQVVALDMLTVSGAQVGHVIATLRTHECTHALVIENDRVHGAQAIRGLFSITHVSKLVGRDVMDAEYAAHSLAEVQQQLERKAGFW